MSEPVTNPAVDALVEQLAKYVQDLYLLDNQEACLWLEHDRIYLRREAIQAGLAEGKRQLQEMQE